MSKLKPDTNSLVIKLLPACVSLLLLVLARLDMGAVGASIILLVLSCLIFLELLFIRTTLINIYADALTEHRLLLFFLRSRLVNIILNTVISIYLSFYLFVHVNISTVPELLFYILAAVLMSLLYIPAKAGANSVVKEAPSKVVSRVGLVTVVVLITVILDGLYNSLIPIDPRITGIFDKDIPLYVIDDIERSYLYLQHFLRTILYIQYNIQSIGLSEDVGEWFLIVRFILNLSPSPYIAYTLIFLSLSAVKKFNIVIER